MILIPPSKGSKISGSGCFAIPQRMDTVTDKPRWDCSSKSGIWRSHWGNGHTVTRGWSTWKTGLFSLTWKYEDHEEHLEVITTHLAGYDVSSLSTFLESFTNAQLRFNAARMCPVRNFSVNDDVGILLTISTLRLHLSITHFCRPTQSPAFPTLLATLLMSWYDLAKRYQFMCKESFVEVLRDLQGMPSRIEKFHGPNSACFSAKLECMAVAVNEE